MRQFFVTSRMTVFSSDVLSARCRMGSLSQVDRFDALSVLKRDLGIAFEFLAPLEAAAVRLFHFEELDWAAVAEALNVSEDEARDLGLTGLGKLGGQLRISKYTSS